MSTEQGTDRTNVVTGSGLDDPIFGVSVAEPEEVGTIHPETVAGSATDPATQPTGQDDGAGAPAAGGAGGGAVGAGSGSSSGSGGTANFLTGGGFALVIIMMALIVAFVAYYFYELDGDFTSSESIRPLLVLTLIVAMLGFGGLLIIRALFAPDNMSPTLTERFRLGREIFLVFSGTFGTIIGFYFGAEDEAPSPAPSVEVAFSGGRVTATVTGGAAPFLGIFTPAGETGGVAMEAAGQVLTLPAAGGACPAGASVVVVDGRGRRAEDDVDCSESASTPANAANAVETAPTAPAGGAPAQ